MQTKSICERIASAMAHPTDSEAEYLLRLKNLSQCFERIEPVTHVEHAFCVWAGVLHGYHSDRIELFRQRRKSVGWDSPYVSIDLQKWNIPDTYDVIVFREQIYVILAELTERSQFYHAPKIFRNIATQKLPFDIFCNLLAPKYSRLPLCERKQLFEEIGKDCKNLVPYYYCSTIINRCVDYPNSN